MAGRKIYFCGSVTNNREDGELYGRLIKTLQQYGTVLTENVGRKEIEKLTIELSPKFIHEQCHGWLQECDVLIAEVTQPSLGVGYEIGRAIEKGKRILCLFRPESGKRLSAMIAGADNGDKFLVKNYSEPEASGIFQAFFSGDAGPC